MQTVTFRAMGCQMMAAVDSDHPRVSDQLARVPLWFERWERILSRFREDSELSRLNREGYSDHVSEVLWDVIHLAFWAARYTGGLVTPTLLTHLEAAGYDRNFDDLPSDAADAAQISPPVLPEVADWRSIATHDRSIRLPAGVRLDLGGIAKGWAAGRAVRRLSAHGPALVDAGGDIAVSGAMADGSPWPVGVDSPADGGGEVDQVELRRGGVATSGRDYRRWLRSGAWQHHILDPRTGRPAHTDVLSATVVASSTTKAEVAAKSALILGSRNGMAWLESQPKVAGLLVLEDGSVLRSTRFRDFYGDNNAN